jgi:site-specific DNA recombinase
MTLCAVAYVRVSTVAQTEGYSLEVQTADLTRYCQQKGWTLKRLFVEPGSSAKTSQRPVFGEMLEYCRKHRDGIDVVLVHKIDRFMRDTYYHTQTRNLLAGYGIVLRSATEPISEDPSGKALEGMLSVFAQLDNDVRSGRTVAGMKAAVESGRWCWKPPRGYVRGKTASMDHDPVLAPVVRQLFEECASGAFPVSALVARARACGLDIHKQVLNRMLRNPLYMGVVRVEKWGIEAAGDFEPLVHPETFWRAQAVLDGRGPAANKPYQTARAEFPLRGLVQCVHGVPLTASWAKQRYRYYQSQPRCQECQERRVSVRAEALEESFVDLLKKLQPEPELVRIFKEEVLNVWKQAQKEASDEQARLTWRLKAIQKKKDRLVEAHVHEQTIDAKTFREHMDRLREQEAIARMERYGAELEDLDVGAVLAFAERTLCDLAGSWNRAELRQKQRLQSIIFPFGVTWDGKAVRTRETARVFGWIDPICDDKERLVTPARFELALPA